jgi:LmbE family N-acetylglucosaminyl deacetylase
MNVLAFGAHPDDVEYYCAGTLARYAQAGARVTICVVTDGRAHPHGDPEQIAALRKAEALASAGLIGAELNWLGLPDSALYPDLATRYRFMDAIRAADPDIIITHPPQDYHTDHIHTSQLTLEAVQMASVANHPSDYAPLSGKPIPVAFMAAEDGLNFIPEDYVDISAVWEVKRSMLLAHRTQYLPGPPYDASQVQEPLDGYAMFRTTRVIAEFYGLACQTTYAEGFRWWRAANRIVPGRFLP